jgi:hypothetical protein
LWSNRARAQSIVEWQSAQSVEKPTVRWSGVAVAYFVMWHASQRVGWPTNESWPDEAAA